MSQRSFEKEQPLGLGVKSLTIYTTDGKSSVFRTSKVSFEIYDEGDKLIIMEYKLNGNLWGRATFTKQHITLVYEGYRQ